MGIFNWKKFPYTNFHDLNLDYFINKFEEIFSEWETLYNTMLTWKDDTDTELAEWKTSVENGIINRELELRAELNTWKAQTETDISSWETATINALNEWKAATTLVFEQIRDDAAGSAETARQYASGAYDNAQLAYQYKEDAEAAAESIEESEAQIESNKNDILDVKTQLNKYGAFNVKNFLSDGRYTYGVLVVDVNKNEFNITGSPTGTGNTNVVLSNRTDSFPDGISPGMEIQITSECEDSNIHFQYYDYKNGQAVAVADISGSGTVQHKIPDNATGVLIRYAIANGEVYDNVKAKYYIFTTLTKQQTENEILDAKTQFDKYGAFNVKNILPDGIYTPTGLVIKVSKNEFDITGSPTGTGSTNSVLYNRTDAFPTGISPGMEIQITSECENSNIHFQYYDYKNSTTVPVADISGTGTVQHTIPNDATGCLIRYSIKNGETYNNVKAKYYIFTTLTKQQIEERISQLEEDTAELQADTVELDERTTFTSNTYDYLRYGLHTEPPSEGAFNAIKRGRQLTDIKWTPVANLQRCLVATANSYSDPHGDAYRGQFTANKEYIGLPYSYSHRSPHYIGINEPIGTFYSCLSNDDTILYTEQYVDGQGNPYWTNTSTYYGITCSTIVGYALDLPNIDSNFYKDIKGMRKLYDLFENGVKHSINDMRIGDVLYERTHVALIGDIIKDGVNVTDIEILEGTRGGCTDKTITNGILGGVSRRYWMAVNEFYEWFNGFALYRYDYIDSVKFERNPYVPLNYGERAFPTKYFPCMPEYGNLKVFKSEVAGNTVKILIHDTNYTHLMVLRDGVQYNVYEINNASYIDVTCEYGEHEYSACLITYDAEENINTISVYCYWYMMPDYDFTVTDAGTKYNISVTVKKDNFIPWYITFVGTATENNPAGFTIVKSNYEESTVNDMTTYTFSAGKSNLDSNSCILALQSKKYAYFKLAKTFS